MRIDRIFSEGEAVNALQQLGFICQQAPNRYESYVISHPQIGGERTLTVEQLCRFAEGAMILGSHLTSRAPSLAQGTVAQGR